MRQASKAQRKPLAQLDRDTGSVLPWSSQISSEYRDRYSSGKIPVTYDGEDAASMETVTAKGKEHELTRYGTITYELPADRPRGEEATQLHSCVTQHMSEAERIWLAAGNLDPYRLTSADSGICRRRRKSRTPKIPFLQRIRFR